MKIRPVGAELFHAERRTDRHNEITCLFRYFASAPKYSVVAICVTSKPRNKTENLTQQNHVSGRNLKF
jgi:hypothetical protein